MKLKSAALTVAGTILMFSLGCAKKEPGLADQSGKSGSKDQPVWVVKCQGAFADAGKNSFYGCGSARGIPDQARRMKTADERAKADLAKAVEGYAASFFQDFVAGSAVSEKAGMSGLEAAQFIEMISKESTEIASYGIQVIDHWTGPDETYSLARLSFDTVSQAMGKRIADRAQDLKMEPEQAMEELDRQLLKRREAGK